MSPQKQAQFIIVLLDNKHCYLAEDDVSKGILNKILVPPKRVFALTIIDRMAVMICISNQLSGDLEPSKEDLRITESLVEVEKLVGIPVLDHEISRHERYTSFIDNGIL